jgi:hypothetical protein
MIRKRFAVLAYVALLAGLLVGVAHSGSAPSLIGTAVLTLGGDNVTTSAVAMPSATAAIGGPITKIWLNNTSTITSSTMAVHCSPNGGSNYFPFYTYANGTNVIAATTAAATTAVLWEVPGDVSVCTHIKVIFGSAQGANESVNIYGR